MTKSRKSRALHSAIAAALLLSGAAAAHAQAWSPQKNVEIVVGVGPGGGNDTTARLMQKIWQTGRLVGASSTVVNKPGGGNAIAWNYLHGHAGDAHFVSLASVALLTNRITGRPSPGHAELSPIARLFNEFIVFSVAAGSPIKTGGELIAQLKNDPAAVTIAIGATIGGPNHLALALAAKAAGVDIRGLKAVAFKSSGESVTAVLGGHVEVIASTATNVESHVRAGRMRVIAVSSPRRLGGLLAETPTWKEQGVDAVFGSWLGVIGAGGLADAQVAYWESVMAKTIATEVWKMHAQNSHWESGYLASREYRGFLAAQHDELTKILAELGMVKQ